MTIIRWMRRTTPGRCRIWVKGVVLTLVRSLPIFPHERTFSGAVGMSQTCQNRPCFNYSMISSARASSDDGGFNPNAFAVFMLMIISYLIGN
jgi:hypothetical protein